MALRHVIVRSFAFLAISVCIAFSFRIGFLHTEIAKVAKTDLELGDPSICVHPFLCVLCDLRVDRLFLIGFLHTEIAKIAKT